MGFNNRTGQTEDLKDTLKPLLFGSGTKMVSTIANELDLMIAFYTYSLSDTIISF